MGRQVTIVAVRRVLGRRARKGGIVKGAPRPQQSVGGGAGIRPAPELGAVPAFSCSFPLRRCHRGDPESPSPVPAASRTDASKKAAPPRNNSRASTAYFFSNLLSYFTNKDFPLISFGCSIPISSISVGTISHKAPPSRSLYCGSAFTRINGTGFVVWAVNGSPVT